MLEPATTIDADELRLAQLACTKLAGMVQGVLSIGLPTLTGGVPEPRGFLEEQLRVMTGFALVLHTVSGKPSSVKEILRLRERSQEVLAALDNLRQRLLEYFDSTETARTLAPARQAALLLCDSIAAYADLIHLDHSRINRVKDVVLQVFAGVEKMNGVGKPTSN